VIKKGSNSAKLLSKGSVVHGEMKPFYSKLGTNNIVKWSGGGTRLIEEEEEEDEEVE
jgi:hypothetical protein